MRAFLRGFVIIGVVFGFASLVHVASVFAQSDVVSVYPPMAPCSVGMSFDFEGANPFDAYEACDYRGLDVPADVVCPGSTIWSDVFSGCIFPDQVGESQPIGGEDGGKDTSNPYFNNVGPAYIANTDGDGANCWANPVLDTNPATTLPEGDLVEVTDQVVDTRGHHYVALSFEDDSHCYVADIYLADQPGQLVVKTETTSTGVVVNQLPNTGVGTATQKAGDVVIIGLKAVCLLLVVLAMLCFLATAVLSLTTGLG